jgi:uncharacterized membrane protein (DUF485 family)
VYQINLLTDHKIHILTKFIILTYIVLYLIVSIDQDLTGTFLDIRNTVYHGCMILIVIVVSHVLLKMVYLDRNM